jgi:hypothetical protein
MREVAEERAWPVTLAVVVAAFAVVELALAAVVVVEPRILIELLPGTPADGVASGRALQAFGALLLVLPIGAATLASLRGARRAAGWLVVLTLLAVLPATVAVNRGADRVRHATPADPSDGACVERSGGDTTCPGG